MDRRIRGYLIRSAGPCRHKCAERRGQGRRPKCRRGEAAPGQVLPAGAKENDSLTALKYGSMESNRASGQENRMTHWVWPFCAKRAVQRNRSPRISSPYTILRHVSSENRSSPSYMTPFL